MTDYITDEELLLEFYMIGFNDELDGISPPNIFPKHLVTTTAYFVGRHHALIGDDVSSTDLLSNEQILEIINNEHTRQINTMP